VITRGYIKSATLQNVQQIGASFGPENINGGDVQRKNVVNNVDKSSLLAP